MSLSVVATVVVAGVPVVATFVVTYYVIVVACSWYVLFYHCIYCSCFTLFRCECAEIRINELKVCSTNT